MIAAAARGLLDLVAAAAVQRAQSRGGEAVTERLARHVREDLLALGLGDAEELDAHVDRRADLEGRAAADHERIPFAVGVEVGDHLPDEFARGRDLQVLVEDEGHTAAIWQRLTGLAIGRHRQLNTSPVVRVLPLWTYAPADFARANLSSDPASAYIDSSLLLEDLFPMETIDSAMRNEGLR